MHTHTHTHVHARTHIYAYIRILTASLRLARNIDDRSRCDEVFDPYLFTSLLLSVRKMPGFLDISPQRMACALLSLLPSLLSSPFPSFFFSLTQLCVEFHIRRCSHSAHDDDPVSTGNAENSSTRVPRRRTCYGFFPSISPRSILLVTRISKDCAITRLKIKKMLLIPKFLKIEANLSLKDLFILNKIYFQ